MLCVWFAAFVFWSWFTSKYFKLGFFSLALGYAVPSLFAVALALFIPTLRGVGFVVLSGTVLTAIFFRRSLLKDLGGLGPQLRYHLPFIFYLIPYGAYLFFQGAYLEVPSDAVGVHLFRIGDWLRCPTIGTYGGRHSLLASTSYWGYLSDAIAVSLGSASRTAAVESLFWCKSLLLSWAVYLAAYRFTQSRHWGLAGLFVFQISSGIQVYSYFRHYTFAPGFLNTLFVLDGAWLLFRMRANPWRVVYWLVAGVYFCVAALFHKQEALFLGIFALGTLALHTRRVFYGALASIVGLIVWGVLSGRWIQGLEHLRSEYVFLGSWGPVKFLVGNPFSYRLGSLVQGPQWVFLSATAALFWWCKREKGFRDTVGQPWGFAFWLSLGVYACCFFPPFATMLSFFFYDAVFYRLIYASLVVLIFPWSTLQLWRRGQAGTKVLVWGAWVVILWMLFFGRYDRGRDFFRPAVPAEGIAFFSPFLDTVAPLIPRDCGAPEPKPALFTDPITAYPLNYLYGIYTPTCYLWSCEFPGNHWEPPVTQEGFDHLVGEFRYFLINHSSQYLPAPEGGHWGVRIRDVRQYYSPAFLDLIEHAVRVGRLKIVQSNSEMVLYRRMDPP